MDLKKLFSKVIVLCVVCFSLLGCSTDNDAQSSTYLDEVSFSVQGDSCIFVGSGGEQYIPVPSYRNKDSIKVGAIRFQILKDESTGKQHRYLVRLMQEPVKLDAFIDGVESRSQLDTIANDGVINVKVCALFEGNYHLLLGIDYPTTGKKHGLNLYYIKGGYIPATGTANMDTLKLVLRHNAQGDRFTKQCSYDMFVNYGMISSYYFAYDVTKYATQTNMLNPLYVDVEYTAVDITGTAKVAHAGLKIPSLKPVPNTDYERIPER